MKLSTIVIFILRGVFFLLLWTVISGANFDELFMVIAIILLATLTSLYVLPRGYWSLRPMGCLRFLPYFLWHSLLGGWDVAKRALSPAMPLAPAVITFQTDTNEAQRVLLAWAISLLPGTASIAIEGQQLTIHVLDKHLEVETSLRVLEAKVKRCC